MKKVSLCVVLLFCSVVSFSQVTVNPGLRVGAAFSRINDIDGSSRNSFYLGGFAKIKLAKWYALQPELNYTQQGTKWEYETIGSGGFDPILGGGGVQKETLKLNYLGLTLNNKFYPVAGFHLMIGPYLDFLVSDDNISPTNKFDIGVNLGLGYEFKNGIGAELRFRPGMVDIFEDFEDSDTENAGDYWNSSFQIGITYTFKTKK